MRNDSIETLLLRHYGSTAQAPIDLEETLLRLNTVWKKSSWRKSSNSLLA